MIPNPTVPHEDRPKRQEQRPQPDDGYDAFPQSPLALERSPLALSGKSGNHACTVSELLAKQNGKAESEHHSLSF